MWTALDGWDVEENSGRDRRQTEGLLAFLKEPVAQENSVKQARKKKVEEENKKEEEEKKYSLLSQAIARLLSQDEVEVD